jgi:D-alanyl-lipoteichoic acid acyltransferase DltB (MBOAT superfamily)
MLFNTWTFWAFAAIVIPLYWLLPFKWQNRMLLLASYVFYGWWNWRFLFLIAGSTAMDYWLGVAVNSAAPPRRKRLVALSVAVNLTLLGVFKYYNFFARELVHALNGIGIPASAPVFALLLPVGISFYTFQSMSYVIDIARGKTQPARTFFDFALYVAFFPHLVAGPIMRSGNSENGRGLLNQLENSRIYRSGDFQLGLFYITSGLFKKVVIGDNLAPLVASVFGAPVNQITGPECLAALYAFAIQIYADFSGYSSIAQGIAKWMGIDLMTNFRQPYLAASPSDFWRRWHISLSTWLRDYVYISAGGSRDGQLRTYRNLMLTMVLGGIWHGANWTFLAWGVFHGALLCIYHFVDRDGQRKTIHDYPFGEALLRMVVMFHLVCLGWLLFRADSLGQAWDMLHLMTHNFVVTPLARTILQGIVFYAAPLLVFEYWIERRNDLTSLVKTTWIYRAAAYNYCMLMLILFAAPTKHEFIYFQF